jgi:hypothetical protein
MIRRSITLMELPAGGWLWKEHDRTYKSAATALRAIRRADRLMVRPGSAVTTVITWEPCTYAGQLAAKAVAK